MSQQGNLADLRDQVYFQSRLPAGSADTDQHDTAGLVFALKTTSGGALVFYHLTARLSLAPPPGQTINFRVPGYYPPARPSPPRRSITPTSSPSTSRPALLPPPSSQTPPVSPGRADRQQPNLASNPPCPRIWAHGNCPPGHEQLGDKDQ